MYDYQKILKLHLNIILRIYMAVMKSKEEPTNEFQQNKTDWSF